MPIVVAALLSLRSLIRSRAALQLEILALRHQLQVLERSRRPRLRLTAADRLLWVSFSRIWREWRPALVLVQPATVIAWHRRGFRLFWTWKSRHRTGRPTVPADVRELIHTMSRANPLWGAPRIHGELRKIGIAVAQSTVAKYMVARRRPPSPTWRTFLANHVLPAARSRRRLRGDWWNDHGHTDPRRGDRSKLAVAEPVRRALHRINSARVSRSCDRGQRCRPAAHRVRVRRVLHALAHASRPGEGLAHPAASEAAHDRAHRGAPRSQRPAPSLRPRRVVPTTAAIDVRSNYLYPERMPAVRAFPDSASARGRGVAPKSRTGTAAVGTVT